MVMATTSMVKPDYIIEPGKRVGKVKLGDTRSSTQSKLGTPKKRVIIDDRIRNDYWESKDNETIDIYYRDDKVIQIAVSSALYKIDNQINTNSSLSEIREVFDGLAEERYFLDLSEDPSNKEPVEGKIFYTYYDDNVRGVAFVFVYDLAARVPKEGVPSSIIVHLPNEPLYHEKYEHPVKDDNDPQEARVRTPLTISELIKSY
jgi:hypothetical protein